jgi:hypothetical protein
MITLIDDRVPSGKGFFRTLSLRVGRFRGTQRPKSAFGDAFVGVPHVVARQVDVILAQWRDVRDKAFIDLTLLPQSGNRPLQIHRVP